MTESFYDAVNKPLLPSAHNATKTNMNKNYNGLVLTFSVVRRLTLKFYEFSFHVHSIPYKFRRL